MLADDVTMFVAPMPGPEELHIVGVYQPANGAITVDITRAGVPLTLVLNSYEPVNWTLTLAPGVLLTEVILDGYNAHTIQGQGGATVTDLSGQFMYLAACGYFWPMNEAAATRRGWSPRRSSRPGSSWRASSAATRARASRSGDDMGIFDRWFGKGPAADPEALRERLFDAAAAGEDLEGECRDHRAAITAAFPGWKTLPPLIRSDPHPQRNMMRPPRVNTLRQTPRTRPLTRRPKRPTRMSTRSRSPGIRPRGAMRPPTR